VFYPKLDSYISQRILEFDQIPAERKTALGKLARFVDERQKAGERVELVFICTHNSRRSHIAQIWAQTAARYHGITDVQTFSGGTEATAFNTRAVAAMKRSGFEIDEESPGSNPTYNVRFDSDLPPMSVFSKVYDQEPNPTRHFGAVMTCSRADEACPVVAGASFRISIPYDDPKEFDGTNEEALKYDESCRRISREMLFVFSRLT
jgi:arsenate reductase